MNDKKAFYTNQQAIYNGLVVSIIGWGVLVIVSSLGGYFWLHSRGLWSGVLGGIIGGVFFIITTVVALIAFRQDPQMMMLITIGSWLIKILVLLIILKILQNVTFIDHRFFGITIIGALFFVLGVQIWTVLRCRTLIVEDDSQRI